MGTAVAFFFFLGPCRVGIVKWGILVGDLSRRYMGQMPCLRGLSCSGWVDKPQEVGTQGAPELFFSLSSLSLCAVGWP